MMIRTDGASQTLHRVKRCSRTEKEKSQKTLPLLSWRLAGIQEDTKVGWRTVSTARRDGSRHDPSRANSILCNFGEAESFGHPTCCGNESSDARIAG